MGSTIREVRWMNPERIEAIRQGCKELRKMCDTTVDGEGKNLHDIKVTFDYVIKYVREDLRLDSTVFGEGILEDAEKAGNIISQFWLNIEELEKALSRFCGEQEDANRTRNGA